MKQKLFSFIDSIFFFILGLRPRIALPNTILLVKLDGIGDYTLFRNFIPEILNSSKYSGFNLNILGNKNWKEMNHDLDNSHFSNTEWIDIPKFHKSFIYKYKTLWTINKYQYESIIHPTYSRCFFVDLLISKIKASDKISFFPDLSNQSHKQRTLSNSFYTEVISTPNEITFEFQRNKIFFEKILSKKICLQRPKIDNSNSTSPFHLPNHYCLIFIGAGHSNRKWNIENYVNVAKYIQNNSQFKIILSGSKEDLSDAEKFCNQMGSPIINLVGDTSLSDLIFITKHAKIVISNETGLAHISASFEKTYTLVISNGNYLTRFCPHPHNPYYILFYPQIINQSKSLFIQNSNNFNPQLQLDINKVSANHVISGLEKIFIEMNYD
jgi:ADP-heptose:LPS heptosyltransferase